MYIKFHPYSLKISANVKIAMQCFEIFGVENAPLVASLSHTNFTADR